MTYLVYIRILISYMQNAYESIVGWCQVQPRYYIIYDTITV